MDSIAYINILDMIKSVGEESVRKLLSSFECRQNPEIESFVKNNAIDFSKRKISITYLLLNQLGDLLGIFSLTHKAIEIKADGLSSTANKKMQRYAKLDEQTRSYMVSAYLIAQFGKNYRFGKDTQISGQELMGQTLDKLYDVQHEIGGGVVYLECEDKQILRNFYTNSENRFRPFSERYSGEEGIKYIQMMRFL